MGRAADRHRVVANALSLARVPLAALLWAWPHEPAWTISILLAAGATDVLDGWVVRRARRRRSSEHDPGAFAAEAGHGAIIDGIADKVFVVSAVALLAVTTRAPWWSLVLVPLREILFVPIMLAYAIAAREQRERVDFTAGVPGKGATLAQFLAIVLGLAHHPLFIEAAIGAGFLGAVAALYYVVRVTVEPRRAPA